VSKLESMLLFLEALHENIRLAIRRLRRDPATSISILLLLCIGIGSSTAVFSVVDRVLFRRLPYANSDRLVSVGIVAPLIYPSDWLFSATYQDWRTRDTPFDAISSWAGISDCDVTENHPSTMECARVEASFLPTLGVTPLMGRNISPEEDRPGAEHVALLSHGIWQSRFASNPDVVGQKITVDGLSTEIIGVLPKDFELPNLAVFDIIVPEALKAGRERQRIVRAIGRLKAGVSPWQAEQSMEPLRQHFVASAPSDFRKLIKMRLRVESLRDMQTREYRTSSWLLFGAVFAVLLIACGNMANLLLARAARRRREVAVQVCLGAGRGRMLMQGFADSLLLGTAGGTGGCVLAAFLLRAFVMLAPATSLRLHEASINLRVLAFACLLSIVCIIVATLIPLVEMPGTGMLAGARSVGASRGALRQLLVIAQVTGSLMLLSCAGLLVSNLLHLERTRIGMRTEHVMTATLALPKVRYSQDSRQIALFEELEQTLREIPGVSAVAISDSTPPGGDPRSRPFVSLKNPGGSSFEKGMEGNVIRRYVTPDYFAVLGIPIVRGRGFTEDDRAGGPQSILVNQTLASRLFPGQDAIGKSIGDERIIGVVGDVRNTGLAQNVSPEMYYVRKHAPDNVYANQRPPYGWRRATVLIRTSLDDRSAANLLTAVVAQVDANLTVEIGGMRGEVEKLLQRPRFLGAMLAVFAAIAMLLAGIGLYGLVAHFVIERTQEIGVRAAIGATPSNIFTLILSRAMRWVAVGAAMGALGSVWVARLMKAYLADMPEADPGIIVLALLVLFAFAFVAVCAPCLRAMRLDPLVALRHE
jgi:putative ABC transport system permease protein